MSYTCLLTHVVFSTKDRRPFLKDAALRSDLHAHHRKQTFEEELRELLEKHGIDYDPRYLWT